MKNSDTIASEAQPPSILPDSTPVPAVVPSPLLPENSHTAEADVRPPPVLLDTTLCPVTPLAPAPALAPAPSLKPVDSTQHLIHKSRLQEYAQKSRIQLPVYQTLSEGSQNAPQYRSTVLVDEVYYVSPNTFRNRKSAEQDAARIALEYISKKTKDDGFLLLQKDMMFCKSILSEYTDKMNLKRPTYTTNQHKGAIPVFQSSLIFDGVVYTSEVCRSKKEAEQLAARAAILSLLGDVGNPKSQQTLAKIVASKVKLHSTFQKVKDSFPTQMHPEPEIENTEQHIGISVKEKDEVEDFVEVNEVESNATPKVLPMTCSFQPKFRSPKSEAPSCSLILPIEFVPSNSGEPLGDDTSGAKKRSKNEKKAHKKLLTDNLLQTDHLSASQSPPSSVAQ